MSTPKASDTNPTPFVYGRPVWPSEFLGRETELRTIFNRLRNQESTAVVGEPHIGKTSLLLKLMDNKTQQHYLGNAVQEILIGSLDMHPIDNDYTPDDFWEEALEPLREHPGHATIAQRLDRFTQSGYTRRALVQFFNYMGQQGRRLALLLDEFEQLLIHPNFPPAFFALLRSLATRTGGLSLVTACRLSVAEMNRRSQGQRGQPGTGSPFFNNFIEIRLRPFDEKTRDALLGRADETLNDDEKRLICRVAGCHPFLCQAMAAALVETTGDDRQVRATERFYERISSHFDDLWRSLDDHTRTTAVILSLVELGGRALGQDFAYGEIEKIEAFGPELHKLAERGLAKLVGDGWQFDLDHLLLWRGERWTVGAQAFTWWVQDVIIAETRQVPAYNDWLANKKYRLLLTQEQWDWLSNTVRNAPKWATHGVGTLARLLFDDLMR